MKVNVTARMGECALQWMELANADRGGKEKIVLNAPVLNGTTVKIVLVYAIVNLKILKGKRPPSIK